ncbi:MAG TPA: hypothetical protein VFH56_15810 [Acidimicrobiales bacterium]|nr:hypothetical protein [Acidimicrobiales bacterium]
MREQQMRVGHFARSLLAVRPRDRPVEITMAALHVAAMPTERAFDLDDV